MARGWPRVPGHKTDPAALGGPGSVVKDPWPPAWILTRKTKQCRNSV